MKDRYTVKSIAEYLAEIDGLSDAKSVAAALAALPQPHRNITKDMLENVFGPAKFIDVSSVEYEPGEYDNPGVFMMEMNRAYVYVVGRINLPEERLRNMLANALSMMIPADAELYKAMLAKKLPYKKINKKAYERAFT